MMEIIKGMFLIVLIFTGGAVIFGTVFYFAYNYSLPQIWSDSFPKITWIQSFAFAVLISLILGLFKPSK